jgi:hypothetical protein
MERLSSCYFCGAAPDQPLATYRVTDRLATSSAGTAITLCPACHRKLDALLNGTGTSAVESDHSAGQPEPNHDTGTPDSDTATPDDTQTPDHDGPADSRGDTTAAKSRVPDDEPASPAGSSETTDSPDDATSAATRETAPRERETARGQRDTSVSKREYKKVLRLLQNREEAVDRDELEGLATSAYGLTPAECAKILDVAIERDHIEQRGTKLVLLD